MLPQYTQMLPQYTKMLPQFTNMLALYITNVASMPPKPAIHNNILMHKRSIFCCGPTLNSHRKRAERHSNTHLAVLEAGLASHADNL